MPSLPPALCLTAGLLLLAVTVSAEDTSGGNCYRGDTLLHIGPCTDRELGKTRRGLPIPAIIGIVVGTVLGILIFSFACCVVHMKHPIRQFREKRDKAMVALKWKESPDPTADGEQKARLLKAGGTGEGGAAAYDVYAPNASPSPYDPFEPKTPDLEHGPDDLNLRTAFHINASANNSTVSLAEPSQQNEPPSYES